MEVAAAANDGYESQGDHREDVNASNFGFSEMSALLSKAEQLEIRSERVLLNSE